jgi:hypothetical protein
VVETERLLVQVAEQVKRFDAHVGAVEAPLQQRPEVLAAVRVDRAVRVGFGLVDHFVCVVGSQSRVGRERIGVDARSGFDVFADDGLNVLPFQGVQDVRATRAVVSPQCRWSKPITATLPARLRPGFTLSAFRLLACMLRALPPM